MWETLKEFFERQSALANFFQIAGAILGVVLALWRGWAWVRRRRSDWQHSTVEQWLNGRLYGPASARSLKVVVVDDKPDDYPLDALRRLGYSVTHIGHLTLAEVPSLFGYDCVLLDINGVLEEDPKRGGLEILRRLKSSGGPYVVAVSSRGFDITMSDFFMLADHRLKKPIPPAEVERIIEQTFSEKFSAKAAASRVDQALSLGQNRSRSTRRAIRAIRVYLETETKADDVRMALGLLLPNDRLETVLKDLDVVRRSLTRTP